MHFDWAKERGVVITYLSALQRHLTILSDHANKKQARAFDTANQALSEAFIELDDTCPRLEQTKGKARPAKRSKRLDTA